MFYLIFLNFFEKNKKKLDKIGILKKIFDDIFDKIGVKKFNEFYKNNWM